MERHPDRREIISAHRIGLMSRQVIDFRTGYTLVESARWGDRGEAIALSPDLEQVAFSTRDPGGNSIVHFASGRLAEPIGIWRGADFPWDVAFDLASERLAASSNRSLQVLSVESHELLDRLDIPPCGSGRLREVGFSRGGALAFIEQE